MKFFSSFFPLRLKNSMPTCDERMEAYKKGNYSTALNIWPPLAQQGNSGAHSALGHISLTGEGLAQNDTVALEWFRLAAEQGDPDGQFFLGMMYCRGLGFPERSSNNVFRLRYLPYTHMWLSLAASQGNERAEVFRDVVEEDMSPSQIQKAKELFEESVNRTH